MMSHKSKQELLDTVRPRYRKAGRKEKKGILDELVASSMIVLRHPSVEFWECPRLRMRPKHDYSNVICHLTLLPFCAKSMTYRIGSGAWPKVRFNHEATIRLR
jgi:hypothetical protein